MIDPARTEEFVQLFTTHSRWIYSYILTLIPASNEADDVFQETSTTLWRKFEQFQSGTSFRHWAISITSYEILQYRHHRKKDGRVQFLGDAAQEVIDRVFVDKTDELDDLFVGLDECMSKLEEQQRVLLRHRHEPGVTIQEIANETGCSVWSLYRQLSRLYQLLYHCMKRRNVGGA